MEQEDRERLVRVEEGVKAITKAVDTLSSDRIEIAKNLAVLNTKSGMFGFMGGFLASLVTFFLKK